MVNNFRFKNIFGQFSRTRSKNSQSHDFSNNITLFIIYTEIQVFSFTSLCPLMSGDADLMKRTY